MATIHNPVHFLHLFNCSCSNHAALEEKDGKIVCGDCGKQYRIRDNILELVDPLELDADTSRELKAHTYDLSRRSIDKWTNKGTLDTDDFYAHFSNKKIAHMLYYLEKTECDQIFSLGTGTGFELKQILPLKKFDTIYASDLSHSALRLVPHLIGKFDVKCVLFTSDLQDCPIKCTNIPILIYEALHHTADMHITIEQLLTKNYNNIVLVEPSTNFIVFCLTKLGLAQREEYSGLIPKWLEIKKIRKICRRHGYKMNVTTMWEIPEVYMRKLCKKKGLIQSITISLIDAISVITNLFNVGSFSIIHLKRI